MQYLCSAVVLGNFQVDRHGHFFFIDDGDKSTLRRVIEANPLTPVIEGFRGALLGTYVDWTTLWYPVMVSVLLVMSGLALFQRVERSYVDVV